MRNALCTTLDPNPAAAGPSAEARAQVHRWKSAFGVASSGDEGGSPPSPESPSSDDGAGETSLEALERLARPRNVTFSQQQQASGGVLLQRRFAL